MDIGAPSSLVQSCDDGLCRGEVVGAEGEVQHQFVFRDFVCDRGNVIEAGEEQVYAGVCRLKCSFVGLVAQEEGDAALPVGVGGQQGVEDVASNVAALY
jgi:hypothetical protein